MSDWSDVVHTASAYLALRDRIGSGSVPAEVGYSLKKIARYEDFDALGESISETRSAIEEYQTIVRGLRTALKMDTSSGFGDTEWLRSSPYTEQLEKLTEWFERLPEIRDLINLNREYRRATREGLAPVVELSQSWADAPKRLLDVLTTARYESIISRAYSERPELRNFDSRVHQSSIDRFATQDLQAFDHNRSRVASVHWNGLPKSGAGGEVGVLRREFEKRRRHLPIRQLITRAGRAIQAIKPVFMMSPLSIANYLPPGEIEFDIVVFDEASQVRPVDALGALMRGKQAVVVGDSEQLPPTSFFDRMVESDDDDYDDAASDMESILGLFRAQGGPTSLSS